MNTVKVRITVANVPCYVECIDAPTLTCTGEDIKRAGNQTMTYPLYRIGKNNYPTTPISDMEATVLGNPDIPDDFCAIPPATMY